MYKEIKRKLVLVAGILFILLGLFGLALPFLQGFLFIAIGIILLSVHSPKMRAWMDVRTMRYPKLHTAVKKLEKLVLGIIGEP